MTESGEVDSRLSIYIVSYVVISNWIVLQVDSKLDRVDYVHILRIRYMIHHLICSSICVLDRFQSQYSWKASIQFQGLLILITTYRHFESQSDLATIVSTRTSLILATGF